MSDDFLALAIGHGAVPSNLSLPELETVIEHRQVTFIEVGRALMEIRDRRLYRETHATFETYCRERWGWGRAHANRHIDATCVADALASVDAKPETVREARAMLDSLPPKEREQVRAGTATPAVIERMATPKKWQGDSGVLITTGKDEWPTPPHIIEATVGALGGIDLDPCASRADRVPAGQKFTESDNGLSHEWHGRVYMNPPYGRAIAGWVEKLRAEYSAGRVTEFVALVPARTDTAWFQALRDCHLCLIRGRLTFGDAKQGAPFPSMAAYMGNHPARFAVAFVDYGDIWERVAP